MKLWDLSTQHCIQTIVAHRSEVWSMAINQERDLVFTGSGEGELKAWKVDRTAIAEGLKETETGEVSQNSVLSFLYTNIQDQVAKMIHAVSSLPLASKHKVSQLKFHPTEPYLAVQSHDRSVEVFRIRSEEEVQKKLARRQKRSKEKKEQKKGKGKDAKDNEEQEEVSEATLVDYFTPHLVVRASGKIRSFDFGYKSSSKGTPQVRRMLPLRFHAMLILCQAFCGTFFERYRSVQYPPAIKVQG